MTATMMSIVCWLALTGTSFVTGQYAFLEISNDNTTSICTCQHDFNHESSSLTELSSCLHLKLLKSVFGVSGICQCTTNSSQEIESQALRAANVSSHPWRSMKAMYICCNSLDDEWAAAMLFNVLNFAQVEKLTTFNCHKFSAYQTPLITLYSLNYVVAHEQILLGGSGSNRTFDLNLGHNGGNFGRYEDHHVVFLSTEVMKTDSNIKAFSFLASSEDSSLTHELVETLRRAPYSLTSSPNRTVMFTPIYV